MGIFHTVQTIDSALLSTWTSIACYFNVKERQAARMASTPAAHQLRREKLHPVYRIAFLGICREG